MVGDSIVFGWSRVGKPVWDEFYGERKAVNIGSSGDQTNTCSGISRTAASPA